MPIRRTFSKPLALAAILLAVIGCALPSGFAQEASAYKQPDFEKKLFAREAVLLERNEIDSTVKTLAALAANFPSSDDVDNRLRAKALAIALRLDGTDEVARATNSMLSRGKAPEPVSGVDTVDEIAQQLWEVAGYLETTEKSKDEQVLQFCLVDIARELDPTNLSESNRYPTQLPSAQFAGWGSILISGGEVFVFPGEGAGDPEADKPIEPDPDPDAVPDVPITPTRTAKGELNSIIPSGSEGKVASIRADLKAGGGTAPLAIIFADEKGGTGVALNSHRESLVSALTETQGAWPQDGGVLVLTVPEESARDAGLLLPCALLADSLIRERELEAGTVALGVVAPEGSLIKVDRLHQRLNNLDSDDIETILLPEENLPQLQDLALMGSLELFFHYQFILVGSLKEAAALASATDREENFAASLRDFQPIQDLTKDSALSEITGFTIVKTKLSEVIALEPRHASAAILLAHGNGELPTNLTLAGSLTALHRATSPIVNSMKGNTSPEHAAVLKAFERVNGLEPILHNNASSIGSTMSGLLKSIGTYSKFSDKSSAPAEELKAKIFSTWDEVRKDYSRLRKSAG